MIVEINGGNTTGGGLWCLVNFAVVNFAAGNFVKTPGFCVANFAHTPRNVVVCRALWDQWSLATGATYKSEETHLPHSASEEHPVGLRS